uniref:Membrane-anchored junction protein n=1 Tax=virus sp. ctnRj46 TaxID=2826814 RepID=A0A8S5R850_9VIRU|nr:MAG TPA: membrane-anchored junction protein [virus sp. ctnRj46]
MLIDKHLDSYIYKFKIKMLPPTTQEDIDRRDNMSTKITIVSDIMNLLSDLPNESAKLDILKKLLSGVISDGEILQILSE